MDAVLPAAERTSKELKPGSPGAVILTPLHLLQCVRGPHTQGRSHWINTELTTSPQTLAESK